MNKHAYVCIQACVRTYLHQSKCLNSHHQIYMHAFKHESTNMHTYAHRTEYMCDFMYEHVSSIQTHHTLT